ncbi:hypothetical protein [Dolichospermum phage Dfl-JY45]
MFNDPALIERLQAAKDRMYVIVVAGGTTLLWVGLSLYIVWMRPGVFPAWATWWCAVGIAAAAIFELVADGFLKDERKRLALRNRAVRHHIKEITLLWCVASISAIFAIVIAAVAEVAEKAGSLDAQVRPIATIAGYGFSIVAVAAFASAVSLIFKRPGSEPGAGDGGSAGGKA